MEVLDEITNLFEMLHQLIISCTVSAANKSKWQNMLFVIACQNDTNEHFIAAVQATLFVESSIYSNLLPTTLCGSIATSWHFPFCTEQAKIIIHIRGPCQFILNIFAGLWTNNSCCSQEIRMRTSSMCNSENNNWLRDTQIMGFIALIQTNCWTNSQSLTLSNLKSNHGQKEQTQTCTRVHNSCSRMTVGVLGVKCFEFLICILPLGLPQRNIAWPSELRRTSTATQRSFTAPNCSLVFLALDCALSGQPFFGTVWSSIMSLCHNLLL